MAALISPQPLTALLGPVGARQMRTDPPCRTCRMHCGEGVVVSLVWDHTLHASHLYAVRTWFRDPSPVILEPFHACRTHHVASPKLPPALAFLRGLSHYFHDFIGLLLRQDGVVDDGRVLLTMHR